MLRFSKYTGAGNDFVIAVPSDSVDRHGSEAARRFCSRRTGAGVDGLILVYAEDGSDSVRVRFFNPDGSEFSTCGNGTRCAARFAHKRQLVGTDDFTVVTSAGPIGARVAGERVSLEYSLPVERAGPIAVAVPGGLADGWLLQFGVPHFVLPLGTMPEGAIDELGARIRRDPQLGPGGANVNLVVVSDPGSGTIRTFERGVEDETMACGSGSMATVIGLRALGLAGRRMDLSVRGGEVLGIELVDEPVFDGTPVRVRLTGPAVHVFDGEFDDFDAAE